MPAFSAGALLLAGYATPNGTPDRLAELIAAFVCTTETPDRSLS